jgi:hypothetical protein
LTADKNYISKLKIKNKILNKLKITKPTIMSEENVAEKDLSLAVESLAINTEKAEANKDKGNKHFSQHHSSSRLSVCLRISYEVLNHNIFNYTIVRYW